MAVASDTEKLSRFVKAVNAETDMKIAEIINAAEAEKKRIIEETKAQAYSDAHEKVDLGINRVSSKYTRLVSKAELDGKKAVLQRTDELVRELFVSVKLRLSAFRHTEEYVKYLASVIKSENPLPRCVIRLMPEDMQLEEQLKSLTGTVCRFEADVSIKLGGLAIFDKPRSVIIDRTLDLAVEEQRRAFCENSPFSRGGTSEDGGEAVGE